MANIVPALNPEQYADQEGIRCPVCLSNQLEGNSWNADSDYATLEAKCLKCDSSWLDHYKLTGYVDLVIER